MVEEFFGPRLDACGGRAVCGQHRCVGEVEEEQLTIDTTAGAAPRVLVQGRSSADPGRMWSPVNASPARRSS